MGFLEDNHFSGSELAFWIAALLWCGQKGMLTTSGARKAAKLTADGLSWSLHTGGDLRDSGWKKAKDFPKDSIWLVWEDASGRLRYEKIGDDAGKWKGKLKDAMRGAYNGGVKYDAWVEKNRKTWSMVITGVTVAAAVVVSVVATPAAGAGVLAAGGALAAAVKEGEGADALETMATDGTLESVAAAAGADPETVSALSDAAEAIDAALSEPEETSEPEQEQEPAPLTFWQRAGQLIDQGADYATENPGRTLAGAGLAALSIFTGRRFL